MERLMQVYPMNLATAILGDENKAREVNINGLQQALITLTEREQEILSLRFKEKKTLRECGEIEGITRERVRQIEAKALRKLRHPSKVNMMLTISIEKFLQEKKRYDELAIQYELLRKSIEKITNQKFNPEFVTELAQKADALEMPIENLDLSVRTYNCLKRKGIDTLKDITDLHLFELMKIRNLGRKCVEEIKQTLDQYGLSLKSYKGE